jgi:hypothetical protein
LDTDRQVGRDIDLGADGPECCEIVAIPMAKTETVKPMLQYPHLSDAVPVALGYFTPVIAIREPSM